MDIKDFYIGGVHGKYLDDLAELLKPLPDDFVTLIDKNSSYYLSVEEYCPNIGRPHTIQINVVTDTPEEFCLHLLKDTRNFNTSVDDPHYTKSFDLGGVHFQISNEYSTFFT